MLLVGEYQYIMNELSNPKMKVLNLSSLMEGMEQLHLLPPTDGTLPFKDEKEFDIAYANYIMTNEYAFIELMKIMISLYEGKDVYIVVSRSPYLDMVTESLTKFIQVRYRYIAQEINSEEDLEYLDYESSFNDIHGLYNLDLDKERFSKLISPSLPQQNGEIIYGD